MSKATGTRYGTLGKGFNEGFGLPPEGWLPFNPKNGLDYPQLAGTRPAGTGAADDLADLPFGASYFDDVHHVDDPDIGLLSDQQFANHLHRTDPVYWTPKRIRECIDAEPKPIDFGDDLGDGLSKVDDAFRTTGKAVPRAPARSAPQVRREGRRHRDAAPDGTEPRGGARVTCPGPPV